MNREHYKILKQGIVVWNQWRKENPNVSPNLSGACLEGAHLEGADLTGACLTRAYLEGADLREADLTRADLTGADLTGADLKGAYLEGADLEGAHLEGADLTWACLTGADLKGAYLEGADLTEACLTRADLTWADLREADLTGACLTKTILDNSIMKCFKTFLRDTCSHRGKSRIVYRTKKSQFISDHTYLPGYTYRAPYFSHDLEAACHPGLYAGSKRWMEKNYPDKQLVKCLVLEGEYVPTLKGAIRCMRLRVLSYVDEE